MSNPIDCARDARFSASCSVSRSRLTCAGNAIHVFSAYRAFLATLVSVLLLSVLLVAQTTEFNQAEALQRAEQAMSDARSLDLAIYSPRHFSKAESSLEEARSLIERKRERELIKIRLQTCLDELSEARTTAKVVFDKLGDAVALRQAAKQAGGEQVTGDGWTRAEEKMFAACRDIERGQEHIAPEEIDEISGSYRAVRREALRKQYLGLAREKIDAAVKAGAERIVPTLLVRAHQAVGRAETALAQENLDLARSEADAAIQHAEHASALINYSSSAQSEKFPVEATILPYDDLLLKIAERLEGTVDFAGGGPKSETKLMALISAREDSLVTQLANERASREALEQSLVETQTALADAQGRLAQLEQRLAAAEGERSASREALQKKQDLAGRVQRAQEHFKPGEAVVLQDEQGRAIIRIYGLSFPPGKSNLEKSQLKLLDKVALAVREFDNPSITIEGHTDSDGSEKENQTLSEQRALVVGASLADAMKIRADLLTATGYGESRPIADNKTKEGKSRNRRIDVVLSLP